MFTRTQTAPHRYVLLVILLLSFVLRVAWLDQQSLWADEISTLERAEMAPTELLAKLPIEHMPLYFWLLEAWTMALGSTDFALRFPSVVWGVLSVALLYRLALRLFKPGVAYLGALLFSINPFQVWYGQEARMYTLMVALALVALWAVDVALTTPRRRAMAWLVYVAASAMTMYTHLYGALIPLTALLYAVWRRPGVIQRWTIRWRPVVAAHALLTLVCIPWLQRVSRIGEYDSPLASAPTNPFVYAGVYTFGTTLPDHMLAWLGVGATSLYLVGLITLGRAHRASLRSASFALVAITLLIPLVLATALLVTGSVFHARYFIIATPIYSLVLAQGMLALRRRHLVLGVVGLLALVWVSFYSLSDWYWDDQYAKGFDKDYMSFIMANAEPDHALLLNGPRVSLAEHYGGDELDRVVNLRGRLRERGPEATEAVIEDIAEENTAAWLVVRQPEEPGQVKHWLDLHSFQWVTHRIADFLIYAYAFPSDLPDPIPPMSIQGPAPVDLAWAAEPNPAEAGDIVSVELEWKPRGYIPPDLKVSLRLLDDQGRLVWQRDREPGDGSLATDDWDIGETIDDRLAFEAPSTLTPGLYTLRTVLYDPHSQVELLSATLGAISIIP